MPGCSVRLITIIRDLRRAGVEGVHLRDRCRDRYAASRRPRSVPSYSIKFWYTTPKSVHSEGTTLWACLFHKRVQ